MARLYTAHSPLVDPRPSQTAPGCAGLSTKPCSWEEAGMGNPCSPKQRCVRTGSLGVCKCPSPQVSNSNIISSVGAVCCHEPSGRPFSMAGSPAQDANRRTVLQGVGCIVQIPLCSQFMARAHLLPPRGPPSAENQSEARGED